MNKLNWYVEINGERRAVLDKYIFVIAQSEETGSWIVTINDKYLNTKDRLDEAKQLAEKFLQNLEVTSK